jgi:hypothetical protein
MYIEVEMPDLFYFPTMFQSLYAILRQVNIKITSGSLTCAACLYEYTQKVYT